MKKSFLVEEHTLAVIIAWKAWENRNKKATGEQALQPSEILSWCKNYIGTFNNAQLCPSAGLRDVHPSLCKPPPVGAVKLNFDAGFPMDKNFFSAAAVARDCAENCLGWKVEKIPDKLRPVEGEAVAALKAIYLAKGRGWRDIVLEGDCIQLIQALGNNRQ
ncbi:PREDICTED: uncharacterized protein LOC105955379 [Erythranthe guttata]|uniref:uncharacterized protein LOC105955379 n=1 Tax=Erythranthe guttata TaxID=4155 RepID=UPI00064D7C26|nr:PREDICTED: uncharacterized protein LOC105955379 [Erythranthe guttata]|eukprot:XP_012834550.1 PREDICTED: uncharacterized protein LOC105955379 [Erythranthe guttata]